MFPSGIEIGVKLPAENPPPPPPPPLSFFEPVLELAIFCIFFAATTPAAAAAIGARVIPIVGIAKALVYAACTP